MDRIVELVRRRGGVARTSELKSDGASRADLRSSVRENRVLRPRRGIYALRGTPPGVLEALSHCGAAACITAGREFGLWILDLDIGADADGESDDRRQVHTWVHPANRPTRVAVDPHPDATTCCVFHRDLPVGPPSLTRVGIVHCLVQILGCRGEEVFFAALESALRQRLLSQADREQLSRSVPRRDRWLVAFARDDADSGLESLLRLRLHRHGISLAAQVAIPGVGVVDFVIGDCLIIEADGGTHEGPSRHRDRVRDAQAMALGFMTLRFDYAMIVHDWPLVEEAVLAALARNLHRSPAGLTW
ncbi:DUF559 domain-containing protein [Microbacterium ureisolvens]|uniref:DUF559 domain-containing protein n=1 Tax=Microbacterium ureisolvens TaxID=2781186 RepID=UPI003644B8E0